MPFTAALMIPCPQAKLRETTAPVDAALKHRAVQVQSPSEFVGLARQTATGELGVEGSSSEAAPNPWPSAKDSASEIWDQPSGSSC